MGSHWLIARNLAQEVSLIAYLKDLELYSEDKGKSFKGWFVGWFVGLFVLIKREVCLIYLLRILLTFQEGK